MQQAHLQITVVPKCQKKTLFTWSHNKSILYHKEDLIKGNCLF